MSMRAKIRCPKCGRVLGDTEKSIDCNINCRSCKSVQHIKMTIMSIGDFYNLKRKDNNNDKSE